MEILKLCLGKWFGEDICDLFMGRKILHMYYFPLHHVSNIVVLYFNVFRYVMKHRVLKEIYTALVITMNSGRIHLMIEQFSREFAKPHCFTNCHTQCNVLCLYGAQCYGALFPTAPGNHGKPQGEATTRGVFSVYCASCLICIDISLQDQFHTGCISLAITNCASQLSQYMFCSYLVCMSRLAHKLAKHIYYITNFWYGVNQIHLRSNQLSV
jgi:hypothetical protein